MRYVNSQSEPNFEYKLLDVSPVVLCVVYTVCLDGNQIESFEFIIRFVS